MAGWPFGVTRRRTVVGRPLRGYEYGRREQRLAVPGKKVQQPPPVPDEQRLGIHIVEQNDTPPLQTLNSFGTYFTPSHMLQTGRIKCCQQLANDKYLSARAANQRIKSSPSPIGR